mmetsp:Transcript_8873/g.19164  ORF Transcript_8873/g.19164 Transcript_8873/m.19164 type:complete len:646 (+) Transcript_8873:135-2072(+)
MSQVNSQASTHPSFRFTRRKCFTNVMALVVLALSTYGFIAVLSDVQNLVTTSPKSNLLQDQSVVAVATKQTNVKQSSVPNEDEDEVHLHHIPKNQVNAKSTTHEKEEINMPLRLEDLPHVDLSHGTFYFGPHSHSHHPNSNSRRMDKDVQASWTPPQKELLNDDDHDNETTINNASSVEKERKQCSSYNWDLFHPKNDATPNYYSTKQKSQTRRSRWGNSINNKPTTIIKRRRLFLGALIADDSLEVLRAVGMEVYNVFHTVALIECNVTQNLTPRKWRFWKNNDNEDHHHHYENKLQELYRLFGPKTKVSVDYYVTSRTDTHGDDLLHERLQREGIVHRWKRNGMKPNDVAIVTDADETFTRDLLRALQVCDVEEFRRGYNCRSKIIASTLVMESSSECITKGRRWFHPDTVIGGCVDLIGNSTLHPPARREWHANKHHHDGEKHQRALPPASATHGSRIMGYGEEGNYSLYRAETKGRYPLWTAEDIRTGDGDALMIIKDDWSPTGYHFHNFFQSAEEIRFKYGTYGHAYEGVNDTPIWEVHKDVDLGVRCALHENKTNGDVESFETAEGKSRPIYYLNEDFRRRRHAAWRKIVLEEEEAFHSYGTQGSHGQEKRKRRKKDKEGLQPKKRKKEKRKNETKERN